MHNKAMVISGAGGGTPPSPHKPIEADDTLSSKQQLKMLFVIGEGEIDNISQVDVNGSPIQGFDASYEVRTGIVNQSVISGFTQVEAPHSPAVSSELVNGTPIVREVSTSAIDGVRITLRISALYKILNNGDKVGESVALAISTRRDVNDLWTVVKSINKSGKASKPYKMDVRINRPANAAGTVWQLKVQRLSADDSNSKSRSRTYFDNFTEIQDVQLTYPNSALLAVTFNNADELGGNIPKISCFGKFIKVKVPNPLVYNPVSRTYTGTAWDGSFAIQKYATSCVAWLVYAGLTSSRFGLGISESDINKFSFFSFAQECDQLVGDGNGGQEPRFSLDNQFFKRENAPTFLTKMLTLGNAKLINDEFGLISVATDATAVATRIVNNDNVIDGLFDYPSSQLSETYSRVNVTYNDPLDKHKGTTITEDRADRIARFGIIKNDIILEGCKSEGQARRKARWVLTTPEGGVAFKVGLEGMVYKIGEVLTVMDDYKKNVLQQGRVLSASSDASFTTVVLDRSFVFANQSYFLTCYSADASTLYHYPILETNVTTDTVTVNVPGPLPTNPAANSPFIIEGSVVAGKFKVSSIDREEDEFTIFATSVDDSKYNFIENGVVNRTLSAPFINTAGFVVEPVVNIVFNEIFAVNQAANISRISVSWDWDVNGLSELSATFQYSWRRDNLPFSAIQTTDQQEFEIDGAVPGLYEVVVSAFNPRGIRSTVTSAIYNFRTSQALSTLKKPLNFYVINTAGTLFETRDLSVSWFYDPVNDDRAIVNDSLLDYVVEIWSAGLLKNSYTVQPGSDKNGAFTYTFQDNENDHGSASRSVEMRVYSRDLIGDVSAASVATFTNPVPPVVSFTLLAGTGSTYVDITPPVSPDIAGYLVYRDTSNASFIPSPANLKYDGPDNYIALGGSAGVQYFYKVAAYDSFGKSSANISGSQSSTTLAAETDKFAFTALSFTPDSPVVNSVSWGAGTVSINGAAPVVINAGVASWTAATLYLYFDKATVSIGSTTDITVAVTKSQILATYEGGQNLKGGDGTAFFNGAQLIAQSVGANQLVADTAIITQAAQIAIAVINNAHIEDLAVTSSTIANILQSTNFSNVNGTGWQIDKSGTMTLNDLIFKSASATSGARTEMNNEVIKVFDGTTLRVKLGNLLA